MHNRLLKKWFAMYRGKTIEHLASARRLEIVLTKAGEETHCFVRGHSDNEIQFRPLLKIENYIHNFEGVPNLAFKPFAALIVQPCLFGGINKF